MTRYEGYFDGSSKGNPGPAQVGFAIVDTEKETDNIFRESRQIGHNTNNFAEYTGFIIMLEHLINNEIEDVSLFGDSALVINQVTGKWKCKAENLKPLCDRAKKLMKLLPGVSVEWIPREKNSIADSLAQNGE